MKAMVGKKLVYFQCPLIRLKQFKGVQYNLKRLTTINIRPGIVHVTGLVKDETPF